jgi:hypothetical protein
VLDEHGHHVSHYCITPDPIASSLERFKDDAVEAGLLDDDLQGIYDLTILNELPAD